MTPAIKFLVKNNIPHSIHQYSHQSSAESYGAEAANLLGVSPELIYKTLVVQLDDSQLAIGIVPVMFSLNVKAMAKLLGSKKASMASKDDVIRSTGYILGGVSPLAQKKQLNTMIDTSASSYKSIFVSGGKRGLEIELSPQDLAVQCRAKFCDIKQN